MTAILGLSASSETRNQSACVGGALKETEKQPAMVGATTHTHHDNLLLLLLLMQMSTSVHRTLITATAMLTVQTLKEVTSAPAGLVSVEMVSSALVRMYILCSYAFYLVSIRESINAQPCFHMH